MWPWPGLGDTHPPISPLLYAKSYECCGVALDFFYLCGPVGPAVFPLTLLTGDLTPSLRGCGTTLRTAMRSQVWPVLGG